MADEIKTTESIDKSVKKTTKSFLDLTKLSTKSAKDIAKSFKSAEDELLKLNNALKKTPTYFKNVTNTLKEFKELDTSFKKFEKNLENVGVVSSRKLQELNKEIGEATNNMRNLSVAYTKISKNTSIDRAIGKMEDMKKAFSKGFDSASLETFKERFSELEDKFDPRTYSKFMTGLDSNFKDMKPEELGELLNKISSVYLKDISEDMKDLKKVGVFEGLSKESQKFIDDLANLQYTTKSITSISSAIESAKKSQSELNKSFQEAPEKVKGSLDIAEKKLTSIKSVFNDYSKMFQAPLDMKDSLSLMEAEFKDHISAIQQKARELDIYPKDIGQILTDVEKHHQNIVDLKVQINQKSQELADWDGKDLKNKERVEKELRDINKQLSLSKKLMSDSADNAHAYLNSVEKSSYANYGNDKWKDVRAKLFDASAGMDALGKRYPVIGKLTENLSGKFKSLGENAQRINFGMGIFSAGYSLLKLVKSVENATADSYQQIISSGLTVGKSASDMQSTMVSLDARTANFVGNLKASAKLAGSFALDKEEIMGTVSALDQAGLASKNLESQMKPVMGSISGTKDEIVGAAEMVRVFSTNLQTSDTEVAKIMGGMAADFNASMGSMQKDLTDISSAFQQSGMSSTRFMGILSASTAGLTLYQEQVKSAANLISNLGKNTSLSAKGIETFSKGMSEAANNQDLMVKSFALASKETKASMAETMKKELESIDIKLKSKGLSEKERDKLEGSKRNISALVSAIESGRTVEFGSVARYLTPEALGAMKAEQVEKYLKLRDSGDTKNYAMAEKMLLALGMNEKEIEAINEVGAAGATKIIAQLKKTGKIDKKSYENQRDAASEANKLTGKPMSKLLTSIEQILNTGLSSIAGILTGISIAVMALGGADVVSALIGKGGIMTKILGGVASEVAGVAGVAAEGAGVTTAITGLSTVLTGALGVLGVGAAGYGGYKLGEAFNDTVLGKKFSDWATSGAGISDEEAFDKDPKYKAMREKADLVNKNKARTKSNLAPPSPVAPNAGMTAPVSTAPAVSSSDTGSLQNDSRATSPKSGLANINIYVNGNDEERMKRVIIDTVKDYMNKYTRG